MNPATPRVRFGLWYEWFIPHPNQLREVPFRILVVGDFGRGDRRTGLDGRVPFAVTPESMGSLGALAACVDAERLVQVDALDCSMDELRADFQDAPETRWSGLYKVLDRAGYAAVDGSPFGLVVLDFEFGQGGVPGALANACGQAYDG